MVHAPKASCRSHSLTRNGPIALLLSGLVAAAPASASAQPPTPAAESEATPPAPTSTPPPPIAAPTLLPSTETSPPPVAPPPSPLHSKAFSAGAWLRIGGRLQNPVRQDNLDDVYLDQLYLIVTSYGQVTDWLKWQINLNGNVPPTGSTTPYPSIGIQDLIVKIEPHDLFNLWVGRMLVPVDRDNLSGPWFINYWTYPGFFGGFGGAPPPPIGLKTGPNGRDDGATIWGRIGQGQVKYYLGAYNLDSRQVIQPLFSGRLNINFLDPEPGYYHQSAYHGDKDIIAIGGGAQYQTDGSVRTIPAAMPGGMPTADVGNLTTLEGDLLVDKKLGAAGVGTFEAEAYYFDQRQRVRQFYDFGLGYVFPQPFGPGRIAPSVRLQLTQDPNYTQVDGYIQYLIKSHFAKFFLGLIFADMAGVKSKAVQAGIQIIKL
jgi:hypothetical protein